MKVAIAGGTGFVGSHLAAYLVREGHSVVVISRGKTRSPKRLEGLENIEVKEVDLTDVQAMIGALRGCQAVVNCVGIHREVGEQSFDRLHIQATRCIITATLQAEIKRLIHISFLRARTSVESPYHQSKWFGEELVRKSNLSWTILKPGIIFGEGDGFVTNLKKTLTHVPFFALSTGEDVSIAPLHVNDLTRIILECMNRQDTVSRTYGLVGPEVYTLRQLVEITAESIKVIPSFLRLPLFLQRIAAMVMEKTMRDPLVSNAQLTILSEHLIEGTSECDPLPDELYPKSPFNLTN